MKSALSVKVYEVLKTVSSYNARLCLATKTQNIQSIAEANIEKSVILAENRIQELEEKWEYFHNTPNEIHFIGRLQNNKVRKAVKMCDVIESVDSIDLLTRIHNIAQEEGKIQRIFLNINISGDSHKSGFILENENFKSMEETVQKMSLFSNIRIEGLFTILAENLSTAETLKSYRKMKELQIKLQKNIPSIRELSMGMSNDYLLALQAGATIIRIGSGIFGKREM